MEINSKYSKEDIDSLMLLMTSNDKSNHKLAITLAVNTLGMDLEDLIDSIDLEYFKISHGENDYIYYVKFLNYEENWYTTKYFKEYIIDQLTTLYHNYMLSL